MSPLDIEAVIVHGEPFPEHIPEMERIELSLMHAAVQYLERQRRDDRPPA